MKSGHSKCTDSDSELYCIILLLVWFLTCCVLYRLGSVMCVQSLLPTSSSSLACTWWPVIVSSPIRIYTTSCACLSPSRPGCSAIMKKCIQCRTPIEKAVPLSVCCGGKRKNYPPLHMQLSLATIGTCG